LTVDVDGSILKSDDIQRGGRTVGVPGTLAVLKQVHERYGKLPWAVLFEPAIALAENGFPMTAYMHGILSAPTAAADHPDMLPVYFGAEGKVKPPGTVITNAAYATTLRRIAARGPAGLWEDGAGTALVAATQRGYRASLMTEADLAAYRSESREPLCAPFLVYSVCMMAPPSFGGVVVLQVLQMLEARKATSSGAARFNFDDPEFVHYFAEAGKLAQADRLYYVGDPGFVRIPTGPLLASSYLKERAGLIDTSNSSKEVNAGVVEANAAASTLPTQFTDTADATSQLAIVDAAGNALSMTTTINLNFGSRLMVNGFVLNNALTNFTGVPRAGQAAPNRMQAGKRPVTSMAPTIVFDHSGKPVVVGGSAGGGQIVDYISASLVEMLANQRTPAEALARGHVSTAVRGKLQLEKGSAAESQAAVLSAKGHTVEVTPMISGLGFLMRRDGGWLGAADPRRDGVAEGR
jgi:gamma-glutamyltranspeptidase/glutathione hydrolase